MHNVLLVLQDQLRFDVIDEAVCRTPAFDALRAEGTFFRQAYTPTGLCTPARASLLTGLYAHAHGLLNNTHGADAVLSNLPHEVPTVAELVRPDVRTGYVGKWHVGLEGPPARGFDDVRLTDRDPEFSHDTWVRGVERDPRTVFTRFPRPAADVADRYPRRPRPLYTNGAVGEQEAPAAKVGAAGEELLRSLAESDEPFLAVVSFVEPHWPNVLPEPYASMYDPADMEPWANFGDDLAGKPTAHRATMERWGVADFTWDDWAPVVAHYFGAVTYADAQMGRLLAVLDETGMAATTTVIATADHGDMGGSHGHFNKGPLMYEEVYRIPLVVRGPSVAEASQSSALVSLVDLGPTMLDLTGSEVPDDLHGRSLSGILRGKQDEVRDALLCEYHGDEFGLYTQRMIRAGRYKLVYNPTDLRELYDLEDDPAELRNLACDPAFAEARRNLEVQLLGLLHETDDPLAPWAVNTLG